MLMRQKAWAEGMRSLVLYTASIQDQVEISAHGGQVDDLAVRLNDLLLPIVKDGNVWKVAEQNWQ